MGNFATKRRASKITAAINDIVTERNTMICEKMSFAATEAYKMLRANVMFSFADESRCHVIGVTSALPGEGKSLTVINLAYSMALLNKRVLLIDADLRIPAIAKKLTLNSSPGLSNILVESGDVRRVIQNYTSSTSETQFDIIASGDIPPNPSELLGSDRMKKLLEILAERYDYILLDLPPVVSVSDVLVVSRLTSGILMVVRQDLCQRAVLLECVNKLEFVEANIIGVVMNCATEQAKGYALWTYDSSNVPGAGYWTNYTAPYAQSGYRYFTK